MGTVGNPVIKKQHEVKFTGTGKRAKGFEGTPSQWENEIKGRGLSPEAQAVIDALPRVESKSSQTDESLAQLRESNIEKASSHRFPDQALMRENAEQRKGKPMHCLTFLKKLRKAGVRCGYNAVQYEGIIGLQAVQPRHEQKGFQFICGVKLGWTTEYDQLHYDSHGVELNRKYIGWRSVIIQLIAHGILTESKAHKIFGRPQINDGSVLYRRALWQIRNGK